MINISDIGQLNVRIGLDSTGFQNGIGKLNQEMKKVQSEFKLASAELGKHGSELDKLKLKSETLSKQKEIQRQKVEALEKAHKNSVETKGKDSKATTDLEIKLNQARTQLVQMEQDLTSLNKEIEIQSNAFTKLGKNLEGIGSKMKNVGDSFSSVGKNLSMTVTAPIVAAGAGLFKLASDFQEASNTIRIGTGATGEALQALNNDFKAVYTSVNTNIGDASKVIADLNTRTGLSGESLQDLSTQMLRLGKITGENINTLIPATTRMFQDAGISAEDYADSLDYIFKVSQSTGIGVGKLQELMVQFGAPLRQMGFDWQTSAAMLGKFEKEGVNTELVLGSLRVALGKMAKEGISEPNKALAEMIKRIKEAGTAGEANAIALEMFGARAGPDMAAAIREGRMDLDELLNSIKASPETIEKAAKDTETVADKFAMLKNQMAVSLEPLGATLIEAVERAMPSIEKLIQGITGIIERFNNLSPAQQNVILALAAIAAAIGPVLLVIGTIISTGATLITTIGTISTALGALGGIGGALGIAFTALTGPIGLAILAIAAIIAIGVALYKNWDTIKEKLIQLKEAIIAAWNFIKDSTLEVWENIKNAISEKWESIKESIFNSLVFIGENIFAAWENIKNTAIEKWTGITNTITDKWESIKNSTLESLSNIQASISGTWENVSGVTSAAWDNLKGITSSAWNQIKGSIEANGGGIKGIIITYTEIFKEVWKKALELMNNITGGKFKEMADKVINAIERIRKAIQGGIERITEWNNTPVREKAFKITESIKRVISGANPARNYSGTSFFSGGLALVGELGPELVELPRGSRVYNDYQTNQILGQNEKRSGITLMIDKFINNTEKDIEQLAYELEFYRQRISSGRGRG